jgi:hypothetical protein
VGATEASAVHAVTEIAIGNNGHRPMRLQRGHWAPSRFRV